MFRMNSYLAAPALAFLMSGTAHAALTADQVWQSWKDAGALVGLTVSAATENNSGGVLTLNGVSIAPEGVAVAKARHLVPGRLIVQFGDLTVGIDLGLIEGRKELAQSRLCLYAVEHGGIPLLQRQQPALLLPRLFSTAHAVGEKEQQGESRQGGHEDQQQGER